MTRLSEDYETELKKQLQPLFLLFSSLFTSSSNDLQSSAKVTAILKEMWPNISW